MLCKRVCSCRARRHPANQEQVNTTLTAVIIPYRREQIELVLFLILTFAGSTIRNSWATPLTNAARIFRELVLFKGYRLCTVNQLEPCQPGNRAGEIPIPYSKYSFEPRLLPLLQVSLYIKYSLKTQKMNFSLLGE